MREEDCMNAARRVSERERASQMARINTDGENGGGDYSQTSAPTQWILSLPGEGISDCESYENPHQKKQCGTF